MDKQALVTAVVEQLEAELARQTGAAHLARAEATDQESKSEGKYDMRSQSAAYLAAGQAQMAAEVAAAITGWLALVLKPFGPQDAVALGAVATLTAAGRTTRYFLGPFSGGLEVTFGGQTIVVVTPASPLGRQLLGRRVGEQVTLAGRPRPIVYALAAVA